MKRGIDQSVEKTLRALLGEAKVLIRPGILDRYAGDALGSFRAFHAAPLLEALPDVVVIPETVEEVAAVVKLASEHRIPLVPYGGGTGVMGGAVPVNGGIVLDLKGLNRILKISPQDRAASVEAGVILEDLEMALNGEGLRLGHDPWSRPIATVGGAIATNGVGYLVAKYGPMGNQVLGLEVVLPNGEILATRGVPKAAGPSLHHLFIGSEGVFGIVTKATLQVFPLPEKRSLSALAFRSFDDGFHAVMELYRIGLQPSVVDFAEEPPFLPSSPHVTLYLGFEGLEEEVKALEKRALQICQHFGGTDLGTEKAAEFWKTRHRLAERYRKFLLNRPASTRRRLLSWPPFDYLHVALPASSVFEYRRRCQAILEAHGLSIKEWSLWGRPEFFSLLIYDIGFSGRKGQERMGRAVDEMIALAQDLGGSMEYCHGVGLKLAHLMEREWGKGLEVMRSLKQALDPLNIMNPGKLAL
ncbi:MAG: FAD-binding oxidoreductase [candidate division NC10 bacterium]|nr:FAD-binding oxidoreductase [candidate division NC10 bacterium]